MPSLLWFSGVWHDAETGFSPVSYKSMTGLDRQKRRGPWPCIHGTKLEKELSFHLVEREENETQFLTELILHKQAGARIIMTASHWNSKKFGARLSMYPYLYIYISIYPYTSVYYLNLLLYHGRATYCAVLFFKIMFVSHVALVSHVNFGIGLSISTYTKI